MIIIIGRILSSIGNKLMKFKTKSIAPSFIRAFSFFLNHLRIAVIYKYTKPNSIVICAGTNKNPWSSRLVHWNLFFLMFGRPMLQAKHQTLLIIHL